MEFHVEYLIVPRGVLVSKPPSENTGKSGGRSTHIRRVPPHDLATKTSTLYQPFYVHTPVILSERPVVSQECIEGHAMQMQNMNCRSGDYRFHFGTTAGEANKLHRPWSQFVANTYRRLLDASRLTTLPWPGYAKSRSSVP